MAGDYSVSAISFPILLFKYTVFLPASALDSHLYKVAENCHATCFAPGWAALVPCRIFQVLWGGVSSDWALDLIQWSEGFGSFDDSEGCVW